MIRIDTSFSLGFGKPTPTYVFGSSDKAFGWNGAGGSFGFADPDTGIGFGYVMNKMGYTSTAIRANWPFVRLFPDVLGERSQLPRFNGVGVRQLMTWVRDSGPAKL